MGILISQAKGLRSAADAIAEHGVSSSDLAMLQIMLREAADTIEYEISERYMELPVDANGESIHIGDLIEYRGRDGVYKLHAQGVYVYSDGELRGKKCVMNERLGIWEPDKCNHVNPRTLEGVLRDVWEEALDYAKSDMWRNPDEVFAERADEIRELLRGDA